MSSSKKKKSIPFEFVLERLAKVQPLVRPMFGCHAVYVDDKIVLILREKGTPGKPGKDDGIWVATTVEHHVSLRQDFPSLRSISVFGPGETGWQNLPMTAPDFEESAERLCEQVLARDPRVGKVPGTKKKKPAAKRAPASRKKSPAVRGSSSRSRR